MNKDAYYFPHDSNAKDDPKCVTMIERLGLEGYGIYWMLIEVLREQPTYSYPLSLLPALARKFKTRINKVNAVVNDFGLFTITDDEEFRSESLCRRMSLLDEMRAKRSRAGTKGMSRRWANRSEAAADNNVITSKEYNNREYYRREYKSEEYNIPHPVYQAL